MERTQTVTGSAAAGEFHRQQIAEHRQRRAADERFPFNAGRLTAKALSRLGVRRRSGAGARGACRSTTTSPSSSRSPSPRRR